MHDLEEVADVMKTVDKRVEGTSVPSARKKTIIEVYDLVRHEAEQGVSGSLQEGQERVHRLDLNLSIDSALVS